MTIIKNTFFQLNNIFFKKKQFFIYLNYVSAYIFALLFLILSNYLELNNISKYILIISLTTVFASVIYSSTIKSKIINENIVIDISRRSLFLLLTLFLVVSVFLLLKYSFLIFSIFVLNIIYEICYNLIGISFIKRNKISKHSKFQLAVSLMRNAFLLMHFFFNDLLIIIGTFYLIFTIIFFVVLNKLNLVFSENKRKIKILDISFVFSGVLIFQVDKILGENLLSKDNYFIYFLFYKFASIFQIFGSILTQPIRNTLISKEKITSEIINELKVHVVLLFFLLVFINFFLVFLIYFPQFNFNSKLMNFYNLIIFDLISVGFVLHLISGFFIDSLFINDKSKKLFILNIFILFLQIPLIIFFKFLIVWALIFLLSQVLLLIFSFYLYKKYIGYV